MVEVSRPCCEIETIEKVIANTAHIVKVESKVVEIEEVKVEEVEMKKEVKEVEVKAVEVKAVEKLEEKVVKVEEKVEKVEEKAVEEVKAVEVIKAVEVKAVEVKVVEKEEVKAVEKVKEEKTVIEFLKNAAKEKSPLLPPIKEESMDVHPFLLEYGTAPIKSNTVLIQNQTYQIKKKNKKRD